MRIFDGAETRQLIQGGTGGTSANPRTFAGNLQTILASAKSYLDSSVTSIKSPISRHRIGVGKTRRELLEQAKASMSDSETINITLLKAQMMQVVEATSQELLDKESSGDFTERDISVLLSDWRNTLRSMPRYNNHIGCEAGVPDMGVFGRSFLDAILPAITRIETLYNLPSSKTSSPRQTDFSSINTAIALKWISGLDAWSRSFIADIRKPSVEETVRNCMSSCVIL